MIKSIDEFIGSLKDGLARPNRYVVSFNMPRGIGSAGGIPAEGAINQQSRSGNIAPTLQQYNNRQAVEMLCHSAQLPGRNMDTYEHMHFGSPYSAPISQGYSPASFSFHTNTKYDSRKFFEIWQETIVNLDHNTFNFYDEFVSDVTIQCFNREGQKTYEVLLHEAYPVNISSVSLGYGEKDGLVDVSVTMAYRYWSNKEFS